MANEFSGNIQELGDGIFMVDIQDGAIVAFENTVAKKGEPTRVKYERQPGEKDFVRWGTNNLFPYEIRDLIRKNTILAPRLRQQANMIYGGGIMWGYLDYKDDGTELFIPQMKKGTEQNQAIRAFLRSSNFERWFHTACQNHVYFGNGWNEFIFNNGGTEIERMKMHAAKDCRYGWMNKQGIIDTTFIYGDWEIDPEGKGAAKLVSIDPSFDQVEQLREKSSAQNVVLPVGLPDTLASYYALPAWDSARQSKWIENTQQIPIFKKALMQHGMSPKYQIRVAEWYWKDRNPDWGGLSIKQRNERRQAYATEVTKMLASPENAGKSLFSIDSLNPASGKMEPGVVIQAIPNNQVDGQYLEDLNEGSSQLLTALAEDPEISGNGPGKSYGSGSGSNKKVAWDIFYSMARSIQDAIVQPLGVKRDHAGWDSDLIFRTRYAVTTNLYSGEGLPKTSSTLNQA